jgi:hypothetical protein
VQPAFRLAQPPDLALLHAFMREFYAIDGYPFEEQDARAALLRLIGDDSLGRVWLIMLGDEPVGYLVLAFGIRHSSLVTPGRSGCRGRAGSRWSTRSRRR